MSKGKLVGLVPAAGQGKRVGFLPCSKEIFPVGFTSMKANEVQLRPKAVGEYILECLKVAGVKRVFIIVSPGKWDIPTYFGDGSRFGLHIAYLIQEELRGMPYALNLAYQWLDGDETVLFGMPDTIINPQNAFQQLLEAHCHFSSDLTLGLFPTNTPTRFGMVAFDANGRMLYTVDKPERTNLQYMWGIGCWGPKFTGFLYDQLQSLLPTEREIVLGDMFQMAVNAGLNVRVFLFESGEYIDIGVPEELVCAVRRFSML